MSILDIWGAEALLEKQIKRYFFLIYCNIAGNIISERASLDMEKCSVIVKNMFEDLEYQTDVYASLEKNGFTIDVQRSYLTELLNRAPTFDDFQEGVLMENETIAKVMKFTLEFERTT